VRTLSPSAFGRKVAGEDSSRNCSLTLSITLSSSETCWSFGSSSA
jgi:hypothetical protein